MIMKNTITVTVAIMAIIMAMTVAILKPMRNTGYEPTTTEKNVSEFIETTMTDSTNIATTETESTTETTTKIPLTSNKTTVVNSEPEESTKKKYESKIVSLIEKEIDRVHTEPSTNSYKITPAEFRRDGVIYYNGYRFTYYSEKVLPGKGLKIPGRHSDGNFVRDENNYICVASSDLPKGTIVDTPFGAGKVYDTGCSSGTIDIYCSW